MATETRDTDETLDRIVDVLDGLHKVVSDLSDRVEKLELSERGLIPYSNDPTEIEHSARLIEVPKRQLHSWAITAVTGEEPITKCLKCDVLLTDCGATEDSWYCE